MTYEPWKGFMLIGVGIVIDVLIQLHYGRGGYYGGQS